MAPEQVAPLRYGPAVSPLSRRSSQEGRSSRGGCWTTRRARRNRAMAGEADGHADRRGRRGTAVAARGGLHGLRPCRRARAAAADRRSAGPRHDQPHAADAASRARGWAGRARDRADAVARGAVEPGELERGDDHPFWLRRGRCAPACRRPRARRARARGRPAAVAALAGRRGCARPLRMTMVGAWRSARRRPTSRQT